ncbi:MAG TPA: hypothetical protein VNA26_08040 [Chitinophagaceae bacterium]|nr:hypothetical protein [Chitinophagaceae bacterium]
MNEEENIEERQEVKGAGLKEEIPNPPIPAHEMIPENTASLAPATLNPQPSTMEVHHHGHVHEKKKWLEYLFQFFMLFLAVFCGFLAEYQLEHKIEKDREKQYMEGMLEDLVADTAMLSSRIQFATRIVKGLDSLQNNFFDTDNTVANTQTIYRQNTTYIRLIVADFNDQTAIQLRNSGNMRLIRKREIVNAISQYWIGINSVENVSGILEMRLDEIYEAGYNIFNRKNIIRQFRDSLTRLDNVSIDPAARLMTNDKNIFINYANRINRLTINIDRFLIPFLKSQKQRGDRLIHLIKKEYHLK